MVKAVGLPVLRGRVVRAGFAVLPVVSLGLLCPVPSLVLALRRRRPADWPALAGFSAVLAAWGGSPSWGRPRWTHTGRCSPTTCC